VTLVRKAADETRITFFTSLEVNKVNELIVTSNELTNFTGLVASGLGPDVSRGPPVLVDQSETFFHAQPLDKCSVFQTAQPWSELTGYVMGRPD
jgi:hypothetical protein